MVCARQIGIGFVTIHSIVWESGDIAVVLENTGCAPLGMTQVVRALRLGVETEHQMMEQKPKSIQESPGEVRGWEHPNGVKLPRLPTGSPFPIKIAALSPDAAKYGSFVEAVEKAIGENQKMGPAKKTAMLGLLNKTMRSNNPGIAESEGHRIKLGQQPYGGSPQSRDGFVNGLLGLVGANGRLLTEEKKYCGELKQMVLEKFGKLHGDAAKGELSKQLTKRAKEVKAQTMQVATKNKNKKNKPQNNNKLNENPADIALQTPAKDAVAQDQQETPQEQELQKVLQKVLPTVVLIAERFVADNKSTTDEVGKTLGRLVLALRKKIFGGLQNGSMDKGTFWKVATCSGDFREKICDLVKLDDQVVKQEATQIRERIDEEYLVAVKARLGFRRGVPPLTFHIDLNAMIKAIADIYVRENAANLGQGVSKPVFGVKDLNVVSLRPTHSEDFWAGVERLISLEKQIGEEKAPPALVDYIDERFEFWVFTGIHGALGDGGKQAAHPLSDLIGQWRTQRPWAFERLCGSPEDAGER